MAHPIIHTPALILHRYLWSESSWILKCLSPELGILSVVAKGAKRPKSPFMGRLEPLYFVDLSLSYHTKREMQTLVDVQLIEAYPKILGNLHAYTLIQTWIEWILHINPNQIAAATALKDLIKALQFMENDLSKAMQQEALLSLRFMLKLAQLEGYALNTEKCAQCSTPLSLDHVALFQKTEGTFLCSSCSSYKEVDPRVQAILAAVNKPPQIHPSWMGAEELLWEYLCMHTDHPPKKHARELLLALR